MGDFMMAAVMDRMDRRVDENLQGTDALCVKWAVEAWDWTSGRASSPIYRMMRQRAGASLPSGPIVVSDEVLVLDKILANSEPRYFALVKVWYVDGGAVITKAKKLHTNRTDLYALWRRTLEYLRGRLHSAGIEA